MLRRDDEFEIDTEFEEKNAGYAGDLSSTAQRQRALQQQKARALQKQQLRRGQMGAVQANRGFTGAARTINANRARTFSAPKTIDPLEGEDDVEERPTIKRTGYAENFRGSSRNVTAGYGGVYETLHPRVPESNPSGPEQVFDPRVANVEPVSNNQQRFSHPNEVAEEKEEVQTTRIHTVESKVEQDLKKRGISASFDPNPEEEEDQPKRSSKSKLSSSKSKSSKSAAPVPSASKTSRKSRTSKRSSRPPAQEEEEEDLEEDIAVQKDSEDEEEEEEREVVQASRSKRASKPSRKESEKPKERSASKLRSTDLAERDSLEEKSSRTGKAAIPVDRDVDEDLEDDNEAKSSEDEYEAIERPLATSAANMQQFDFTDMRTFLTSPIPKSAGVVQCYIERSKNGANRLFPEYHMFLKEGDRFLMAAKKRAKNRTSNYSISMSPKDLNKSSGNFIGKLRANFIGTEFQIFDHGLNPKHADPNSLHVGATPVREELGAILYASNVLGSRGPRKMRVALPAVKKDGTRQSFRPTRKGDDILSHFKERDMSNITELVNKPPRWNDHVSAFVLNFNGRVTMASVKNFQLISPEDEDSIILQFGRVGKDLFTADLAWPLSPLQAFAICLSSFDSKLACE